jgi:uncharacterized protein (DUF2062 family)
MRTIKKASRDFIAFAYLKPRRFIAETFSKKGLNRIIDQIVSPNQSDELKAFSAALGIFMGIIPIWGFQTIAAIFLAVTFRLNKALVIIFSHVSFPPFMPLIIFLSYRVGRYWMGAAGTLNTKTSLEQYIYGSITLAIVAAMATGLFTLALLKLMKMLKQYKLTVKLKKAL